MASSGRRARADWWTFLPEKDGKEEGEGTAVVVVVAAAKEEDIIRKRREKAAAGGQ